ncbi:MAG: hypothetical protein UR81_C0028G0004 [Candidatus Levybacteria bacterium GW2011_GWB1_35_5]|nr:MAG: hypothetical protein UR81_C0028G0004 [Candidatus Levybacteria bacterium GW2011_GWB1_35_5]
MIDMMDNTQNPNNNNVDSNGGLPPVQNPNTNGQSQNGQVTPTINREVERPVSDFIAHSEKPPVLDKEVEAVGVKHISERPQLSEEHQQIGVKDSLENNVPNIESTGNVQILDQSQAQDVVNKYKNSADPIEHVEQAYFLPSIFGLATLILKNLQKVHAKITGRAI